MPALARSARRASRDILPLLAAAVAVAAAAPSWGQTPAEAAKVDKAKPQEVAATPPPAPTDAFAQEAQVTAGALLNDGNVSSVAGRLAGFWQMKYRVHGLRVETGAGLTSIAQDPDADPANGFGVGVFDKDNRANTSANLRARYDFFLSPQDSLYSSGFAFHDSAANLVVRLRADAGYRRYFFRADKHALSGEVGAVYTIDNSPVGEDSNGDTLIDTRDETGFEKSGGTWGARVALGYTNALLDNVAYTATFEAVPNILPEVDAPFEVARVGSDADNKLGLGEALIVTWVNTLTVQLNTNLNIGVNLSLIYDNGAIARRNAYTKHDVATAIQLGYKLF